jgi:hypothetical protein
VPSTAIWGGYIQEVRGNTIAFSLTVVAVLTCIKRGRRGQPQTQKRGLLMQAYATVLNAHQLRESLQEEQQLRELVKSLSQEIERLAEDNAQLNAAVQIYREVARRYAAHPQ